MSNTNNSYTLTTTCISVHSKGHNAFFDVQATHVSLEDEAGGAFLVLTQYPDEPAKPGVSSIRIDPDEFPFIVEAANKLLAQELLE